MAKPRAANAPRQAAELGPWPNLRTTVSWPILLGTRLRWALAATATLLPGYGEAWPPRVLKWVGSKTD